jgi:hypothetical protein
MAGMLNRAHVAINSSGKEDPSRKLKAERAWSSTYKFSVPSSRFSVKSVPGSAAVKGFN